MAPSAACRPCPGRHARKAPPGRGFIASEEVGDDPNVRLRGQGNPAAAAVIRRIWPSERDKLRAHLLRLDAEDRVLRFGGYSSDAQIEAYCRELDWHRAVVIGYLVEGELRGVGELKPLTGRWPRAAEVALSVERPFQNRGIGTELLRRLLAIARNRGLDTLCMVCLLENRKVVRMVRKLGGSLSFEQGEVEARLALPWPDHRTLLLELLDEAGAVLAVLYGRESQATAGERPTSAAIG